MRLHEGPVPVFPHCPATGLTRISPSCSDIQSQAGASAVARAATGFPCFLWKSCCCGYFLYISQVYQSGSCSLQQTNIPRKHLFHSLPQSNTTLHVMVCVSIDFHTAMCHSGPLFFVSLLLLPPALLVLKNGHHPGPGDGLTCPWQLCPRAPCCGS